MIEAVFWKLALEAEGAKQKERASEPKFVLGEKVTAYVDEGLFRRKWVWVKGIIKKISFEHVGGLKPNFDWFYTIEDAGGGLHFSFEREEKIWRAADTNDEIGAAKWQHH